ncbi:unnamed protein product [Urochloa humidicola]
MRDRGGRGPCWAPLGSASESRHQTERNPNTTANPSSIDQHTTQGSSAPPGDRRVRSLAAEAVESAALALERVDDVHGGDGLAAGVLRVGDGVADDVLEEDLEHAAGLLVDEPRDALHAAPARQPPDRRLRDALDVVAEDLAVTLRAALAQTLASLAAARHGFLAGGESSNSRWGFGDWW